MKTAAIIAEYNPFHNGHLYHINKTKEITSPDYLICLMSGNFTQRGEPAVCNKWERASWAIKNGVDLVIEIPTAFACNSAEYFAYGAVSVLNKLGVVDALSFGSEDKDIESFTKIAEILAFESEGFKESIKEKLSKGISFPKARYEALAEIDIDLAEIIKSPNNILAVEYIKQLILQKSKITPVTVRRISTGYHDIHVKDGIASATAIRKFIENENWEDVYKSTQNEVAEYLFNNKMKISTVENYFFTIIKYKSKMCKKEDINKIFSVNEGLENRLLKEIETARNLKELIERVKSKRYTRTKIQRVMSHILLDLTYVKMDEIMDKRNNYMYAHVLGVSENGKKLLGLLKKVKCDDFEVITNMSPWDIGENLLKQMDIKASDIYSILTETTTYENSDLVRNAFTNS